MPLRGADLRIRDILAAIEAIQNYTRGLRYEQFVQRPELLDAVLHRFVVIGEAASHLSPELTDAHPHLPWRKMRDMRNYVAHVYFQVEPQVVWQTIHEDLPPLIEPLQEMLRGL